jgi:hypothetical protein
MPKRRVSKPTIFLLPLLPVRKGVAAQSEALFEKRRSQTQQLIKKLVRNETLPSGFVDH